MAQRRARLQKTEPESAAEENSRPEPENEREPFPKRRSWAHDNVAGVERASYSDREKKIFQSWIQFRDGKPSPEIREVMKEAGFRWESEVPPGGIYNATGAWVRDNKGPDLAADRVIGDKIYNKIVDMIYTDKGLTKETTPDHPPF